MPEQFPFILRTLFLHLLLLPAILGAQEHQGRCGISISGRVNDAYSGEPVPFASIYLVGEEKGAICDNDGRYYLPDLCEGMYTLRVSHTGYQSEDVLIILPGKSRINIQLTPEARTIDGVEVTARKCEQMPIAGRIDVPEEKLRQSRGQNLADALKSISGVSGFNSGSTVSKPVIHGMHSNRVLILNNGIRQEGQQWGSDHAPEIDPMLAGRLSVVKGAAGVQYGPDAMAGVVIVEPRALPDSIGLNAELALIGNSNGRGGSNSGWLEGRFKRLPAIAWRVQGTYKRNGTLRAPNYILANSAAKENNFSWAVGMEKRRYGIELFYSQFNTDIGILSASHLGNLTDLQKAFQSAQPLVTGDFTYQPGRPFQHVEHELFKSRFHLHTGPLGKLSLTLARQYNLRREFDKHGPATDFNTPQLHFELSTFTGDLVWEHLSFKGFTGSVGLSGLSQGNTYEGRAVIPNYRNQTGGAFLIERWRKGAFEIEGGVRYDYRFLKAYRYVYAGNSNYVLESPEHVFSSPSATVGFIFRPDSGFHISLNAGTAWRAPSMSELYSNGLHHGAAAIEYGNSSLQTERTKNLIASVEYDPSPKWQFNASPYVHFIGNFIYRAAAPKPVLTIRGAFPAFNYLQTNAVLKGLDFQAHYEATKQFSILAKASLLRAWNQTAQEWLILMPADRYEAEFLYRFKPGKAYISAGLQHVGKQIRVPDTGDFTAPPGGYFLVNLHAAIPFNVFAVKAEFSLGIYNLLNTAYRDYLDRFRYFVDAPGRNLMFQLSIPLQHKF